MTTTIKARYEILYQGRRQVLHLTRNGAEAHAFRLAQDKGWKATDIIIQAVLV